MHNDKNRTTEYRSPVVEVLVDLELHSMAMRNETIRSHTECEQAPRGCAERINTSVWVTIVESNDK